MFIDSHCHLDRIDLAPFENSFDGFMQQAKAKQISQMLCVSIDLASYPELLLLSQDYPSILLSVGVHPNVDQEQSPSVEELVDLGSNDKVIAIGETGLDYFHSEGNLDWQHERFKTHIEAAKMLNKPLIIHTREAGQDALEILKAKAADQMGGVIHCFSEDWDYACRALDLGFYISFSGIVTFKNAKVIQEVAKKIPADRFLIETDSPYLAPTPFRGKPNYPLYVPYVAEQIATLRGISTELVAQLSADNFRALFNLS